MNISMFHQSLSNGLMWFYQLVGAVFREYVQSIPTACLEWFWMILSIPAFLGNSFQFAFVNQRIFVLLLNRPNNY